MQKLKNILRVWLPLAVVTTVLCGLVYLSVQQVWRQYANDPQIQMAQDAADALARGAAVEAVLPANQIDVARSLAPFMIVFNEAGKPLASSGLLRGQIPALPGGVLDYAKQQGENRLTWQPEPGVCIASVVAAYAGGKPGFVLVGRSLRETEKRAEQAQWITGLVWLAALGASLATVAVSEYLLS